MIPPRTLSFLIFLLVLCLPFGCGRSIRVPEGLVGTWKTPEEPYADRFFEIDRTTITFGKGGNDSETFRISQIDTENVYGKGELFTIYYNMGEREEGRFAFYYDPRGKGLIRFRNQEQIIWAKQ